MTDIDYIEKYYEGNKEEAKKQLDKGVPVQYIVGNVDFYGYNFKVNNNVLIPRFETEELVKYTIDYIKKYYNNEKINILDIGTGSGCISITIKKELPGSCVTGVDISESALNVAKENNKLNNTDVNFILSDVFENINDQYDVIISNPPYIKKNEEIEEKVKNNEPHMALYGGVDGLDIYRKIILNMNTYLKNKYIVAFEIGETQSEEIVDLIRINIKAAKIICKKDIYDRDRFIFIIKE